MSIHHSFLSYSIYTMTNPLHLHSV